MMIWIPIYVPQVGRPLLPVPSQSDAFGQMTGNGMTNQYIRHCWWLNITICGRNRQNFPPDLSETKIVDNF